MITFNLHIGYCYIEYNKELEKTAKTTGIDLRTARPFLKTPIMTKVSKKYLNPIKNRYAKNNQSKNNGNQTQLYAIIGTTQHSVWCVRVS